MANSDRRKKPQTLVTVSWRLAEATEEPEPLGLCKTRWHFGVQGFMVQGYFKSFPYDSIRDTYSHMLLRAPKLEPRRALHLRFRVVVDMHELRNAISETALHSPRFQNVCPTLFMTYMSTICIYIYVQIYIFVYVCMQVGMYACMHA